MLITLWKDTLQLISTNNGSASRGDNAPSCKGKVTGFTSMVPKLHHAKPGRTRRHLRATIQGWRWRCTRRSWRAFGQQSSGFARQRHFARRDQRRRHTSGHLEQVLASLTQWRSSGDDRWTRDTQCPRCGCCTDGEVDPTCRDLRNQAFQAAKNIRPTIPTISIYVKNSNTTLEN